MKTRDQIYKREGEKILRLISTYHTLRYEQVLKLFPKNDDSLKALITNLIKQGRIYHDTDHQLLCDSKESALSPDYGMIAAFWVLLDFKKTVMYHTSGDFPVKLCFFSNDEVYEIVYAASGQEVLLNHVMETIPSNGANRLIILESESQANLLSIERVIAFCLVDADGTVSYYRKK